MAAEKNKSDASSPAERKAGAPHRHGGPDDDPCRCKQVAVMTPRQLLGTMLRDLAFWKKKR